MILFALNLMSQEENTGQDFTRPLTRFDLRWKYQQLFNNCTNHILTARTDKPIPLVNKWVLSLRLDVPYAWLKCKQTSSKNTVKGFSDGLFQALFITPTMNKWTYAFGARFIFPTASNKDAGSKEYVIKPTLGIKYDLSQWMKGAWTAVLVRQDIVLSRGNGAHYNNAYIQPILNIDLPHQWFLYFAPESVFNWKTNKWFVPFAGQIGKLFGKKWVVTIEYKTALIDDYQVYKKEVEFRIGYFF